MRNVVFFKRWCMSGWSCDKCIQQSLFGSSTLSTGALYIGRLFWLWWWQYLCGSVKLMMMMMTMSLLGMFICCRVELSCSDVAGNYVTEVWTKLGTLVAFSLPAAMTITVAMLLLVVVVMETAVMVIASSFVGWLLVDNRIQVSTLTLLIPAVVSVRCKLFLLRWHGRPMLLWWSLLGIVSNWLNVPSALWHLASGTFYRLMFDCDF